MNAKLRLTALIALSWMLALGAQAAQPIVKAADDHLTAALNQVTQSVTETPKKHLTNARADLEVAKSKMGEVKKNKGSHAHIAIEKIDAAIAELDSLKPVEGPKDKLVGLIKDAIKEVAEARRAGQH